MAVSQQGRFRPPQDRTIVNADDPAGPDQVADAYWQFFDAIGFTQSAVIADLAASATAAQIVVAVNAILAVLRSQNRIAKS
jgi:hypothetical protein